MGSGMSTAFARAAYRATLSSTFSMHCHRRRLEEPRVDGRSYAARAQLVVGILRHACARGKGARSVMRAVGARPCVAAAAASVLTAANSMAGRIAGEK